MLVTRVPRNALAALAALAATAALPAAAPAAPTVTEFSSGLSTGREPYDVTNGPGGKLWFTLAGTPAGLGSIASTGGAITEFNSGFASGARPTGITFSGGNLYYTLEGSNKIGWTPDGSTLSETSTGMSWTATPRDIAAGPNGDLFYTDPSGSGRIGRLDPLTATVTEHSAGLTANNGPENIVKGPDGAMWFTERAGPGAIGRLDPANNSIVEFTTGITANGRPDGITLGPDGALWFTESAVNKIGRISVGGTVQEFSAGPTSSQPTDITTGADGNLWFTKSATPGVVGRMTPQGDVTEFTTGITPASSPWQLTSGPDGNIWFTESSFPGRIGRITVGPGVAQARGANETASSASFTAEVRPNSQATTYLVEYGTTTALGVSTTPVGAGSGATAQPVSVGLAGLQPDTGYFARLVATNDSGTTASPVETFRTKKLPATGETPAGGPAPSGVSPTTTTPPPSGSGSGSGATSGTGTGTDDGEEPKLGKTVVLQTKNGKIKIKKPGDGYVELGADGQLPVGTIVDARFGRVLLTSAADASGATQTGEFWGGMFRIDQAAANRGLTDLVLTGGNFKKACKPARRTARRAATTAARKSKPVRRLWGSDKKGKFRTRGRDSVATVRGTKWLTEDFCAGTVTKVVEGAVDVTDLRTKRTVLVKAGRSYLVRHKR